MKKSDIPQIFSPQLKIVNAKHIQEVRNYGPEEYIYYWFKRPHHFEYRRSFRALIYCSFDFNEFPFDKHSCDFNIGSISHSINYMVLNPSVLIHKGKILTELKKHMFIEQLRLPFDVHVEILEPYTIYEDGYDYPHAGARIHLKRNDLGVLAGGFYFPTASFSLLSLLSYSIHYENVGRKILLFMFPNIHISFLKFDYFFFFFF